MRRYHLGLRTEKSFLARRQGSRLRLRAWGHSGEPVKPAVGAGWRITFDRRPLKFDDEVVQVNTEPILHAPDMGVARRVAVLVYAAHAALEGSPPAVFARGFAPYRPSPLNNREFADLDRVERESIQEQGIIQMGSVEAACRFAAKVSRNLDGHYACLKLMLSFYDYSFHPMELHPDYGHRAFVQSESPFDHVVWARAITAAYGAVEELRLEVRTKNSQPFVIDGKWDPSCLADLEGRLQKRGINLREPQIWTVRGSRRRIQKLTAERLLSPQRASWSKGPHVRDVSAPLVDTINAASRLRSKVAAHRSQDLRRRLSPVDVHNVQMVARRLLMESFGEWRRTD
jgi:hypothetical protein